MLTLHCTARLLDALKVEPVRPSAATTRLGNWYAGLLAGPRGPIVCVSERTFLPVVVGRCGAAQLPRSLADGLAILLAQLGVPANLIEQERFAMAQASLAKTESRSLIGVLNEQSRMAGLILGDSPQSLVELNRELADNIVKLQFPVELTRHAFGLERKAGPRPELTIRLEVSQLGLVPLALRPEGEWNPDEEYWGEEGDPLPKWAKPIIARGPRPAFEMEQVLPGVDPDDWESDPIVEANDLKHAGHRRAAIALLQGLLARDLRCLDAHAHLGNEEFDRNPARALGHYERGVAIGELSLGADFVGVLPWGLVDNRPWLRCLHGRGLCLWRLGRLAEAAEVFTRMLWLNPSDNQGARINLARVELGHAWTPDG